MTGPLSTAQFEALRRYDTCTVANAIDSLGVRLRNEGYTDSSIRCYTPKPSPLVGYAVTIRIRCSDPQTQGLAYMDRMEWWSHLLNVPSPRVVVIQDVDSRPGTGAFPGEVHATIWRALGCAGAVTNGAVHDLPSIQAMDFHLFASGLTASHSYAHIVEFGKPVKVGGLEVNPGELLHGDVHGVVKVPRDSAEKIITAAEANLEHERRIFELCRSSEFSVDKLREFLKPANK